MLKSFKNIILIVVILLIGLFFLFRKQSQASQMEYQSSLIETQLKNVSKLVVSEGTYSEVMTFEDQKKYFMDFVSFEKKAMMVVNTKVTVAYDLKKMQYDIDKQNKTINIISIPKEEITINPEIKFYDVEQSVFNPFSGKDFNKISAKVKKDLREKIELSPQKKNAENRLITELSHVFFLSKELGWTISYKGKVIEDEASLKILKN